MEKLAFDELISRGELTNAARLFAKEYYESGKIGHTRKMLIEKLADKIDQQGWISVKERLPECIGDMECSKVVWCFDARGKSGFGIYQKKLRYEGWFTGGGVGEDSVTITHWMPLPTPPKEGK